MKVWVITRVDEIDYQGDTTEVIGVVDSEDKAKKICSDRNDNRYWRTTFEYESFEVK